MVFEAAPVILQGSPPFKTVPIGSHKALLRGSFRTAGAQGPRGAHSRTYGGEGASPLTPLQHGRLRRPCWGPWPGIIYRGSPKTIFGYFGIFCRALKGLIRLLRAL